MAIEEINANGGVNGKILKLNLQDHKCDAKEAVAIYKQFKSKTVVFSSVACSGTGLAIAPMLENDKEILFGTTLSTPKMSGVSKNLFRNWASDAKEAELFANLLKTVEYQKIGIIYEETDYAKGLKNSLEQEILANGKKEIYSEGFTSGATDVRSQLTKLQSNNVDVVFISPQTVTTAEVVIKQMTELKFKPRILLVNDNIIKADPLLKKYSVFLQGAYGADYKVTNSKAIEDFKIKYQKRFGEDCKQINICIAQYDAVKLIAKSLVATEKDGYSSLKIQEHIKNVNYQGLSGNISFDSNNDRVNANYTLLKINNGVVAEII
jgi:branched-chain amino acid transport system substrate-binding protein